MTTMEVVDSREVNITVADATQWQIQGLEEDSLYRFLLSGCTQAGCGPPLVQESVTVAQTREYQPPEEFWPKNREVSQELGLAAVMMCEQCHLTGLQLEKQFFSCNIEL